MREKVNQTFHHFRWYLTELMRDKLLQYQEKALPWTFMCKWMHSIYVNDCSHKPNWQLVTLAGLQLYFTSSILQRFHKRGNDNFPSSTRMNLWCKFCHCVIYQMIFRDSYISLTSGNNQTMNRAYITSIVPTFCLFQ